MAGKMCLVIVAFMIGYAYSDSECGAEGRGCYKHASQNEHRLHSDLAEHIGESFHSGKEILWDQMETYIQTATCRCEEAAAKKSYKYFSLRHFGECHGLNTLDGMESSDYCFYHDNSMCKENNERCTGADEGEFVFEVKLQIAQTDPILLRYNSLAGKSIALISAHNRYVVAETDGRANANRVHKDAFEIFKVELLGNYKIALKSHHNKYLVAASNGAANANGVNRGPSEIFTIDFLPGGKVAFKSRYNKYVCAEKDGRLVANRGWRRSWEMFKLEIVNPNEDLVKYNNLAGKRIALRSVHNRYVVAELNGAANANRSWRRSWEAFKVELLGNYKIALKSHHNRYLVALSNGAANANSVNRGSSESFTIEFLAGNQVALRSHFNKYVCAERNGRLVANRGHRLPWEIFRLVIV